jgi:hypothetical protein
LVAREACEAKSARGVVFRSFPGRRDLFGGVEIAEIEDVVERRDGYQIVEKLDVFAEIAASGNPRR